MVLPVHFHALMFDMQDILNHAHINVFKAVFVNAVMHVVLIRKVNASLTGVVNEIINFTLECIFFCTYG